MTGAPVSRHHPAHRRRGAWVTDTGQKRVNLLNDGRPHGVRGVEIAERGFRARTNRTPLPSRRPSCVPKTMSAEWWCVPASRLPWHNLLIGRPGAALSRSGLRRGLADQAERHEREVGYAVAVDDNRFPVRSAGERKVIRPARVEHEKAGRRQMLGARRAGDRCE